MLGGRCGEGVAEETVAGETVAGGRAREAQRGPLRRLSEGRCSEEVAARKWQRGGGSEKVAAGDGGARREE